MNSSFEYTQGFRFNNFEKDVEGSGCYQLKIDRRQLITLGYTASIIKDLREGCNKAEKDKKKQLFGLLKLNLKSKKEPPFFVSSISTGL